MTIRIPLSWILLPFMGIYWLGRVLLGCLLYFLFSMDNNIDPTCEILEERQLLTLEIKGLHYGRRATGSKIKARFTPSFPLRLFGATPKTLVVYRMFDLEEKSPEYRDENGKTSFGPFDPWERILTRALRTKAQDEKKARDLKTFKVWKKSADPQVAMGTTAANHGSVSIVRPVPKENLVADTQVSIGRPVPPEGFGPLAVTGKIKPTEDGALYNRVKNSTSHHHNRIKPKKT